VWVHAVQEYIDSPRILLEFPGIHVTYDLQPSLLKQLLDYAEITPAEREKSGLYRYIGELDNHLKWIRRRTYPKRLYLSHRRSPASPSANCKAPAPLVRSFRSTGSLALSPLVVDGDRPILPWHLFLLDTRRILVPKGPVRLREVLKVTIPNSTSRVGGVPPRKGGAGCSGPSPGRPRAWAILLKLKAPFSVVR